MCVWVCACLCDCTFGNNCNHIRAVNSLSLWLKNKNLNLVPKSTHPPPGEVNWIAPTMVELWLVARASMLAETVNFIKYLHVAVPVDVDVEVEVDPVVRLLILTAR